MRLTHRQLRLDRVGGLGRKGDSRTKVTSLLWAEEGNTGRLSLFELFESRGSGTANMTPKKTIVPSAVEVKGETIAGDPTATGEIIDFYKPTIASILYR